MKEENDKLDIIKIKNLYSQKGIILRMKTQCTDWETLFTNRISDKELVSRMMRQEKS